MSSGVPKVLLLAYHFPPGGGGGVQRAVSFARYLPELGYDVAVVTGTGSVSAFWTPKDETLLGRIPPETEVHRLPGPEPPASAGWRRRAERLLARPSPIDRWWVEGSVRAGRTAGRDADVVLGELVPYETAEAAARLARELGKPWVADLQDPWALDEMWLYPTGVHRRRDLARMRRLLSSAAAVVTNTPEAAERFRARFPELEGRLFAIPNGFDAADFAAPAPSRDDGTFRIVHTGTLHTELGLAHRRTRRFRELAGGVPVAGVDFLSRSHVYLLEALDRIFGDDPTLRSVIELHLAGVASDADRVAAAGSHAVRFRGYLPHRETLDLMRSADLLFLPMQTMPPNVRAGLVPGKTYECVASGRPILAAVPKGDARDLLATAGTASICEPADAAHMAEIVLRHVERWRRREPPPPLRRDVIEPYERRRLTRDLADVLDGARPAARPEHVATLAAARR